MKKIWNNMRMFLWLTFLTGIIYPLLVTGIAQLTMKQKADGNFIFRKDKIIGAPLIAQKFESNIYFWGRPSAIDYNPLPSGGSNLGPISAILRRVVDERRRNILKSQLATKEIPSELLFASGSGLDPHISIQTAYFQIHRIAQARGLESEKIKDLIDKLAILPSLGFIGYPYVNVLLLNLALDKLS